VFCVSFDLGFLVLVPFKYSLARGLLEATKEWYGVSVFLMFCSLFDLGLKQGSSSPILAYFMLWPNMTLKTNA
jgi:hypothetical protein